MMLDWIAALFGRSSHAPPEQRRQELERREADLRERLERLAYEVEAIQRDDDAEAKHS